MPFKKGDPKPPGSGKKKGTKHVFLAGTVRQKLEEKGCDPIEGMIEIAQDKNSSPELRAHCFGKLSRFVYPELRSVEHSGPGGGAIQHELTSPRELLAARIAGIADRATAGSGDSKP